MCYTSNRRKEFAMLLTMDTRKRVSLARLLSDSVSLFNASIVDGKIILEPMRVVPDREAWLYNSPQALADLQQGIKDAGEGKIKPYHPPKK